MNRLVEWSLAVVAEALIAWALLPIFLRLGLGRPPSLPSPLVLVLPPVSNLIVLGLAGLVSVARDTGGHSPDWGWLTWAVVGGLVGVNLYEGLGWVLPQLWGAALALAVVALLADRRRGRLARLPIRLLTAVFVAAMHLFLVAWLIEGVANLR